MPTTAPERPYGSVQFQDSAPSGTQYESRTAQIDGGFIEVGIVTHEGTSYNALGAKVDGDRLFAYVSRDPLLLDVPRNWRITTWDGAILAPALHVVSSRPSTGWFTSRWYRIRFVYDGSVWSGMTAGPGCSVKARRTKLASVYA